MKGVVATLALLITGCAGLPDNVTPVEGKASFMQCPEAGYLKGSLFGPCHGAYLIIDRRVAKAAAPGFETGQRIFVEQREGHAVRRHCGNHTPGVTDSENQSRTSHREVATLRPG